jgi:hypothetical protein
MLLTVSDWFIGKTADSTHLGISQKKNEWRRMYHVFIEQIRNEIIILMHTFCLEITANTNIS